MSSAVKVPRCARVVHRVPPITADIDEKENKNPRKIGIDNSLSYLCTDNMT